ncbi:kinase-like domain-containing protein [Thelephora terrestris]|uniref:Kinase-like domain-containing protein n=1 Tax=Thelephora terrestris TaxID=56493 RepID=A0A9P6HC70_9AGAM|nr:kinase-like domain-containing protein [Thelephora terrestris]
MSPSASPPPTPSEIPVFVRRYFSRIFSRHRSSIKQRPPPQAASEKLAKPSFQEELKTIDPKALAEAMGGDRPPEEPLLSSFQEGFGYFTTVAAGRSLNQYRFVRKLGWASTSSVWLALDPSAATRTYVAIKILTSQATARIALAKAPEYDVFRKIETADPKHPGFNHCLTLRRCFTAKSPAGTHLCFVTDALSLSLATLRPPGQNRFDLPIAKRIIKQVLLALDYLHRECKYIHTDLKSENILVTIPDTTRIDEFIKSNSVYIYGPPLPMESLPAPLVFSRSQPLPYLDLGGSLEDISVRVVDYSEATAIDEPRRSHLSQPSVLRAPEVTLKYPWTSAIDIWTVGCLLFELLTERPLFSQDTEDYSHDLHLQYITECLGPFPPEFLQECEDRDKYFDENGTLLRKNDESEPASLEGILLSLKAVDENDVPGTVAFIKKCLTLDPKLRPSAQELLEDDWLL